MCEVYDLSGQAPDSWSRQAVSRHYHRVAECLGRGDHRLCEVVEEVDQRRDWKHTDLYQVLLNGDYTVVSDFVLILDHAGSRNVYLDIFTLCRSAPLGGWPRANRDL